MTELIDERKIAAGLFELISSNSSQDWFTEQELAVYFRLVNKEGEPVTSGIRKWPHAIQKIIRSREGTSAIYHDSIGPT